MRWAATTAAAALAAAGLLAGCTGQHPAVGAPVSVTAPTRPPPTRVAPPAGCSYRGEFDDADPSEHGVVFVGRSPRAVVIEWLPGLNQRPCQVVLARSGTRIARELAAAVDAAPFSPPGMSACPSADETKVRLFLVFAAHTAEQVTVDLSGCEGIGAPGRSDRQLTQRVADDLGAVAPQPWRSRLVAP